MVYNFFDKKARGSEIDDDDDNINKKTKQNIQSAEELHKPIIRNFKKRTFYFVFIDNIWGADLADMQLISKFNKGFRFLLYVLDIFSKYPWVIPLKNKTGASIFSAYQKF